MGNTLLADCKREGAMSKKRYEAGSRNVFKDLGMPQDLIDRPDPGAQLGPAHGLLPPVAGWHCIQQHLPHSLASQPELPGHLALTHLVDDDRSPNPRV
jgi:hypothetical protein